MTTAQLTPGTTVSHYRIIDTLGRGGQATAFRAEDTRLNRTVVIKVLPPELTQKTANFKRFEREAQLCSQLDHPNICTIYDFNEADGVFYIAMQYVDGKNVRQMVAGRPQELKSALSIAIQVTDALAYAHSKNIIHRDIKAGNVMVTDAGQVKILDFGLAKLLEDDQAETTKGLDRSEITELGIPYGTATYAAPEQAKGERADARSDIFSTGVLLYELLTGIWAFQGKTVIDVRHQVLYGTPKPLAEMRKEPLPPQLQAIIDKALQKEPKNRYQKISQMRDDLRGVLQQVAGGNQLMPVPLAVVNRQRHWSQPVAPGHRQHRRAVEPAREQHHRRPFSAHAHSHAAYSRAARSTSACGGTLPRRQAPVRQHRPGLRRLS